MRSPDACLGLRLGLGVCSTFSCAWPRPAAWHLRSPFRATDLDPRRKNSLCSIGQPLAKELGSRRYRHLRSHKQGLGNRGRQHQRLKQLELEKHCTRMGTNIRRIQHRIKIVYLLLLSSFTTWWTVLTILPPCVLSIARQLLQQNWFKMHLYYTGTTTCVDLVDQLLPQIQTYIFF